MKIVIIHLGRKGAGPAISLEMARALHKQGEEVLYYASAFVENRAYVEKEAFVSRFFNTYTSTFSYICSLIFRSDIKKVIRCIMADKPDIVYSTMNDLWLPFIFPHLKKIKRIKTIHDVGVHEGNNSLFNKWWNNTNFKDAEKFIILSQKYVSHLVERGIDKSDIAVIPHAGFDYYAHLNPILNTNKPENYLLFFGRIDQYKGLEVLLKAMSRIVVEMPDVKLFIAGNGDISKYQNNIDELKSNVDVQNRWIKDEEVAGIVSNASIVILPYTHATQSGVIPLAYAFSKPVIATNVGCLDEQVLDGQTGYLIEGNNEKILADTIIKMLKNPEEIKSMGEYANKYMRENLTWEASARLFIDFIKND